MVVVEEGSAVVVVVVVEEGSAVVVVVVVEVVVDPTEVEVDEGIVVVVVVPHEGVNTVLAEVDNAGATAMKRTPESETIETTRSVDRVRDFTQLNLLVARRLNDSSGWDHGEVLRVANGKCFFNHVS